MWEHSPLPIPSFHTKSRGLHTSGRIGYKLCIAPGAIVSRSLGSCHSVPEETVHIKACGGGRPWQIASFPHFILQKENHQTPHLASPEVHLLGATSGSRLQLSSLISFRDFNQSLFTQGLLRPTPLSVLSTSSFLPTSPASLQPLRLALLNRLSCPSGTHSAS